MALRRRTGDSFRMGIWPGFVDAMTAMLLVFTFVLSIFMITQYFLRETILGQEEQITDKDTALSSLTSRLDALSDMLSLERDERAQIEVRADTLRASLATVSEEKTAAELERDAEREAALREAAERKALEALAASLRTDLNATEQALDETAGSLDEAARARALEAAAAEALRKRLTESQTELTAMELSLDEQREKAEETLLLLAAAREAEGTLKETLSATGEKLADSDVMLALAKSELATLGEASAEEQKQLALLNEQTRALRAQLAAINEQLQTSEAERASLEIDSEQKGDEIANLGARLNTALAEKNALLEEQVDELSDFRSEFFGRVRAALSGRDDIVVKGDRFVFQSEVLFGPGSAELNEDGVRELGKFAGILNDISQDIPSDLDWILRIDGHTDKRPISSGRSPYRDNWELSQARALSVARYLIDGHDIAPRRLAPTGFGEFQPITNAENAAGYARNRRIELKLTER